MDRWHFEALARALSARRGRRGFVGLLAALPPVGALSALLDQIGVEADGRRRRRKKRHKHGRPRPHGKQKNKKCHPRSKAKTCAGKCGLVKNDCKQSIDCGSCACDPPCPICTICNEESQACVPGQDQQRDDCGGPGQVCQSDGTCACDVCISGCLHSSLQAAINAANDDDIIHICPGSYGAIAVAKHVSLIGVGDGADAASNTILDADGGDRVVFVSNGITATLQRLRITGGLGGIVNFGDALTMTGCTVTGNTGTLTGAGIFNRGGSMLTMTNCVVATNSALGANNGGGIYNEGTLFMTAGDISDNDAGNEGGAIFNFGGTASLTGCTMTRNRARLGGGISNYSDGMVTLDSSTLTENIATQEGGAGGVHNADGTVTLQNSSTVSGNTQPNCVGTIEGPGCGP